MKIRSIETISLLVAGIAAAATVAALFLPPRPQAMPLWQPLAAGAAVFLAVYLLSLFAVKKFIVYKIKPIYQIVLSRNLKTRELETEMMRRSNMVEDIGTELSDWAETNQREIERLKEMEKYRREYLGNISHEIKTPIFNIQGYISTLLDGGLEDQSINRKYLERTEKSIDRLINIITDLDEISKLESDVTRLHMERFDIVALTREIVETAELEAAKKSILITVGNSATQPIAVTADKHYIGQVLVNLITNSIRYGNECGRTKISFIDMFDKVIVEVADNGVGISRDDIPRVFERFYRTDKSRSREQGGTGLGLSIVKHIIEAHKENITLRSELGRGSTFTFTLTKGTDKSRKGEQ
ncbi:MAG: sensor histidine kinase [Rikenellaceae bacterium]|nr:sensor histidine kinase [Rikenellaceae bacterium]